jgi:hypothetical protein
MEFDVSDITTTVSDTGNLASAHTVNLPFQHFFILFNVALSNSNYMASNNSIVNNEIEGSSPCSQEPSTGPYTEPDRSSPHHPIRVPQNARKFLGGWTIGSFSGRAQLRK